MSLKRGAERQLTRDGADEDVEEVEGNSGFKKADDNVLASRPMKGLPKRSAPLPSSTVGVVGMSDSTPKFGGPFKGFGSSSSSPFTFSTPTNTSSSAMPPTSSSDSPFKFSTPSVSAAASSATKQFASFLGPSSTQMNGAASTPSTSTSTGTDPQVQYYTDLRGLNLSFKAELEKAISDDPFIDISTVLERYKHYREDIEKKHNPSKKSSGLNGAPTLLLGPASNTSQSKPMPAMPTPPASFSFPGSAFGSSPATSTPVTAQGGFKPSINGTSSGSVSGFSFSTPPSSDKATSNPFSLSSSSTPTSLFGSSSATKPSPFGSTSGTSSSPFGTASDSSAIKPPTSVFGSGSIFGSKTGNIKTESTDSGTNASSAPSNPFGSVTSSLTQPSSGGFSFGAKPVSGSSVGFAFGSPTPEPEGSSSSSKGAGEPSTPKQSTSVSTESRGDTPASTDGGDVDESKKQLGVNPNDVEGEGEEEEETLHTSRVKVYKLGTKDDKPSWAEMGVGMLRLKKHKDLGFKRLLSRNSATGKIMINFKLYKGLSCSLLKQSVSFMGHEEGKSFTFRLRLKTEADALALKEAIDKEVASL